jgi:alanine dehydrogenase
MIIGVPKEIVNGENRVALIPSSVKTLVKYGNTVYMEKGAGEKIGLSDEMYEEVGAKIIETPEEIYAKSEIIAKIKSIQESELPLLKNGQTILSFVNLVTEPELLDVLLKKKITAIAYGMIQLEDGSLPLLTPMSQVAGRVAVQYGARLLENTNGGVGKLIGGIPGVHPAEVLIIGAGVAGTNAAKMAAGMGASVTVLDVCPKKLTQIDNLFNGRINTAMSNKYNLKKFLKDTDIVIGSILILGAKPPHIITEDLVKSMKKGSVIVDISVVQGGMVETIRPTTFEDPAYEKHGVIHVGIPNLPSCVARTATISFNNYLMPYLLKLATKGPSSAAKSVPELYKGINTYQGKLTDPNIAKYLKREFSELSMLIGF